MNKNIPYSLKIYTFWLGDEEEKNKINDKINSLNIYLNPHKIILGPSIQEHNFLYKNYEFYKNSYDNKIYSFCSDVWRFWIIEKNGGLYIDSGFEINAYKMKELIKLLINKEYAFVWENPFTFLSGFFFIKNKNDIICKKFLKTISNIGNKKIYKINTAPYILSKILFNIYKWNIWFNDVPMDNLLWLKSSLFDWRNNENPLKLGSTGSWLKYTGNNSSKQEISDYWIKNFNSFNQKKPSDNKLKITRYKLIFNKNFRLIYLLKKKLINLTEKRNL